MKSFKSVEELVDWVNKNIETLDNGEVTIKDWVELGNFAEKYKRDHDLALKDKEALKKQKAELTKQNAELKEQLESLNNELSGLKEVHTSGDKEALQKLIKEKSELLTQKNVVEAKMRDLEKQVSTIPDLEKQIEEHKAASNRSRILEAVKKAAVTRKVPQHIIDDDYFERVVVEDFTIDETGNIFSKGDSPQSVDNYIAAQQKEKPHWTAATVGAGAEPIRSISEGGMIADEQAILAKQL